MFDGMPLVSAIFFCRGDSKIRICAVMKNMFIFFSLNMFFLRNKNYIYIYIFFVSKLKLRNKIIIRQ
jgi:hypothetical protein